MESAGSVLVAIRHVLRDELKGVVVTTRTITWSEATVRIPRPRTGRRTVELECPRCSASLLAQVRDERGARRVAVVWYALALVCLVLFVCAFAYAVHEGGKTLPEGQSLPVLFPISVIGVFVTFVAGPTLYVLGRRSNGVTLLDAPKPRRQHQLRQGR
ncbi:hypothetical protein OG562_10870 [Streptomyces sp. NBC_01275]|uniref:hypothetical protein n=1 Tax=Streptomyces sp. NBC_01275 TaxID=2903807 RepID=UPI0022584D4B|nr:hypothetical protein [Streptomyces sp. NBC_01275]MCX4761473.1 hypothetical protein [Streptomyces sp. NBC_01275]